MGGFFWIGAVVLGLGLGWMEVLGCLGWGKGEGGRGEGLLLRFPSFVGFL